MPIYTKSCSVIFTVLCLLGLNFISNFCFAKSDPPSSVKKVRAAAPCLSWVKPGVQSRAIILCVHGLGLHSGSFSEFGKQMSMQGMPTYAIDVRGFGSWMDAKGRNKVDFDACIEDVKSTLEWLRRSNPGVPVILLGESMGGAIALQAAAKYPDLVDGLVSCCASGDRFKQKKMDLSVFLHALTGPNRQFDIGKDIINQATDDKNLETSWAEDPLNRMKLSPKELMQFQHFMNGNHDAAKEIKSIPVVMVQGSKDGLVKPEGTEELFQQLATQDKNMIFVENGEHLIFEEGRFPPGSTQKLANWIVSRFAQSPKMPQPSQLPKGPQRQANKRQEIRSLESALHANPENAELHLKLGRALMKAHRPLKARYHLSKAMRLSKGTGLAQEANADLLNLAGSLPAPTTAQPLAGEPMVLVFSAKWCEPCKNMESLIEQAQQKLDKRVKFRIIDIDDPSNQALVDSFGIGPVPTTIFLKATGEVSSTSVGYAGLEGMVQGLAKLLIR